MKNEHHAVIFRQQSSINGHIKNTFVYEDKVNGPMWWWMHSMHQSFTQQATDTPCSRWNKNNGQPLQYFLIGRSQQSPPDYCSKCALTHFITSLHRFHSPFSTLQFGVHLLMIWPNSCSAGAVLATQPHLIFHGSFIKWAGKKNLQHLKSGWYEWRTSQLNKLHKHSKPSVVMSLNDLQKYSVVEKNNIYSKKQMV